MHQLKNIHFSMLVRIDKRFAEVNFRRRGEGDYDGDTSDDRGNRHYFKMIRLENQWHLQGPGLPKWISENERIITESFRENESKI